MSTQPATKRPLTRWKTPKGLTTIVVFLIVTSLVECLVVLYAISLGVMDTTLLQWSFQFPGTSSTATIAVSPLFHLVPLAVILTLAFDWLYLAKKMAQRQEIRKPLISTQKGAGTKKLSTRILRPARSFFRKIKAGTPKTKGVPNLPQRGRYSRATLRSALTVLLGFAALLVVFSLIVYPQLIFHAITGAYQSNPALLNFVRGVDSSVRGFAEAVSPIGWIGAAINNALIAGSLGVGNLGASLGNLVVPFASMDNISKYLFFQNAAAWISVIVTLFYGEFARKGYQRKK